MVIPYQVAQADRIQRDQTAREVYREFLSLTVQKPELANADYCAPKDPMGQTASAADAEYLLYTAEQMIDTSPMTGARRWQVIWAITCPICAAKASGRRNRPISRIWWPSWS